MHCLSGKTHTHALGDVAVIGEEGGSRSSSTIGDTLLSVDVQADGVALNTLSAAALRAVGTTG